MFDSLKGFIFFTEVTNCYVNKRDICVSYLCSLMVCRVFVATWNVGGKSPPSYLNLEDWLLSSPPADIYVLGCVFHTRRI